MKKIFIAIAFCAAALIAGISNVGAQEPCRSVRFNQSNVSGLDFTFNPVNLTGATIDKIMIKIEDDIDLRITDFSGDGWTASFEDFEGMMVNKEIPSEEQIGECSISFLGAAGFRTFDFEWYSGNDLVCVSEVEVELRNPEDCRSLNFDNSDNTSWAELPPSEKYLYDGAGPMDEWTFEGWFYIPDPTGNGFPGGSGYYQTLFHIDNNQSSDFHDLYIGFGYGGSGYPFGSYPNNRLVFHLNWTTVSIGNAFNFINLDDWNHLAFTYNYEIWPAKDIMTVYVNGTQIYNQQLNSNVPDFPIGPVSPFLGRLADTDPYGNTAFFDGHMDEVRIWKQDRSKIEPGTGSSYIENYMYDCDLSGDPNLLAYYPIEKNDDVFQIVDHGTNGLDGDIYVNGDSWTDYSTQNAPLDCCKPCLCEQITLTVPSAPVAQSSNECCYRFIIDIPCETPPVGDINYIRFSSAVPGQPITVSETNSPAWSEFPMGGNGFRVPDWPNDGVTTGTYEFLVCFDPSVECRTVMVEFLRLPDDPDLDPEVICPPKSEKICCPPCPEIKRPEASCVCAEADFVDYEVCFFLDADPGYGALCLNPDSPEDEIIASAPGMLALGSGPYYCVTYRDFPPLVNGPASIEYCYSEDGSCDQQTLTCCDITTFKLPDCCPEYEEFSVDCLDKINGHQAYDFSFLAHNKWDCDVTIEINLDCGYFDGMTTPYTTSLLANPMPTPLNFTFVDDGNCGAISGDIIVRVGKEDTLCIEYFKYELPPCEDCCCDDFEIGITPIINNPQIVQTGFGDIFAYIGHYISAGPNELVRVSASIVYAKKEIECNDFGGYIITEEMHSSYNAVQTPNSVIGSPPFWQFCYPTAPNANAVFGNGPGYPFLDGPGGEFSNCGKEVIWGSYCPSPSIDISSFSTYANFRIRLIRAPHIIQPYCFNKGNTIYTIKTRYTFTDITCRTCDTIVTSKILVKPNQKPIAQLQVISPNKGLVTVSNSGGGSNMIKMIGNPRTETINDSLYSIKDIETNETFEPDAEGMIEVPCNLGPDESKEFEFTFENDGIREIGTIIEVVYEIEDPGGETFEMPIPIELSGLVPNDAEQDEIKEVPMPTDLNVMTFAAEITNNNPYPLDIAMFTLRTDSPDFDILMVGKVNLIDSAGGRTLISMLSDGEDVAYNKRCEDCPMSQSGSAIRKYSLEPGETADDLFVALGYGDEMAGEEVTIYYETMDNQGRVLSEGTLTINLTTSVEKGGGDNPGMIQGLNVFPNPSNDDVTFRIDLKSAANDATLTIVDSKGDPIATVFDGKMLSQGANAVPFSFTGFPAGAYYCTLTIGDASVTKLVNIVR